MQSHSEIICLKSDVWDVSQHKHNFSFINFLKNLSLTFSLSQASIVTVIRLVNDAVDTIESEGIFHPLFSS